MCYGSQDDRMCISDDAIARSSVSLRTEHVTDNNDNLFCVYRDNSKCLVTTGNYYHIITDPSRQEYSSIDPITSKASIQNLLSVHAHQGTVTIHIIVAYCIMGYIQGELYRGKFWQDRTLAYGLI